VGQTVVIVDDDEAVRAAIADVLDDSGFFTMIAADGHEAMRVLRAAPRPCVALVDLVMPRVDGWSLIAAIRSDPSLGHVPIICATAGRDDAPLGTHTILRKPFDASELVGAVRRAFASIA
jgi:CheY-like chemotaxis protein